VPQSPARRAVPEPAAPDPPPAPRARPRDHRAASGYAREESRAAYDKAIELAGNTAETAYLTRRRDQLG